MTKALLSLLTCALIVAALSGAPAAAHDLLNYCLTTAQPTGAGPYTCTAVDRNNSGTFYRAYSANKSCMVTGRGSVPEYLVAKGGWASESYVAHNGYLVIVNEKHPQICAGSEDFRIWRQTSGTLGINAAKLTFTSYTTWTHPAHNLDCGFGCQGYSRSVSMGAGDSAEQGYLGMQWNFMYDCRSGRPCTTGSRYPVEVIFTAATWGSGRYKEEYWWGRWTDPVSGQVVSLGLVKFISYDLVLHTQTTSEYPYLVECGLVNTCPHC